MTWGDCGRHRTPRSVGRGRARPCPFVIASPRRGRGNPCFENRQIASVAPRNDTGGGSARRGRARPCPSVIASPRRGCGNLFFDTTRLLRLRLAMTWGDFGRRAGAAHRAARLGVGARQNPWDRVLESSASPLQNTGIAVGTERRGWRVGAGLVPARLSLRAPAGGVAIFVLIPRLLRGSLRDRSQ